MFLLIQCIFEIEARDTLSQVVLLTARSALTDDRVHFKVFIIDVNCLVFILTNLSLLNGVEDVPIFPAIKLTEARPCTFNGTHVLRVVQIAEVAPCILLILNWFITKGCLFHLVKLLLFTLSVVEILDKILHVPVAFEDLHSVIQVILQLVYFRVFLGC